MKKILFILLLSNLAYANTYTFSYPVRGLQYTIEAPSWQIAFTRAAKSCFHKLVDGKNLTFEQKKAIIDICVNPN